MCKCNDNVEAVADFTKTGFPQTTDTKDIVVKGVKTLNFDRDILALSISGCVGASYNASTNEICFEIPLVGEFCIQSPVHIPASASIKACFETCGSILPTGLKATIYVNGEVVFSITLVGFC